MGNEKILGNGDELRPFRTQKDRMFRMIFAGKRELLSLYNAVNNTAYTDERELEITTLENAVYMSVKNDVSAGTREKYLMIRQQSGQ